MKRTIVILAMAALFISITPAQGNVKRQLRTNHHPNETFSKVMIYTSAQFYGGMMHLDLKEMSASLGIKRSQIKKEIKKEIGMSFSEYTEYAKVLLAMDKLNRDNERPNLWKRAGFESEMAYLQTFEKYTGTSPY